MASAKPDPDIVKEEEEINGPQKPEDFETVMTKRTIDKGRRESGDKVRGFLDKYAPNEPTRAKLDKLGKKAVFVDLTDPSAEVSPEAMAAAKALFEKSFPNPDEREPWDVIEERVRNMRAISTSPELQQKYKDGRFCATAITDMEGKVIGYSQFSLVPLKESDSICVYGQYTCVDEDARAGSISHGVDAFRTKKADDLSQELGYKNGVAGAFWESEMPGQAADTNDMLYTMDRLDIHNNRGARMIVLEMDDGSLVSPHIQPRLSEDSNPIVLGMMYKAAKYEKADVRKKAELEKNVAYEMVMSYIDNFDREDFDPNDVEEARQIIKDKFSRTKRVLLLPPNQSPDIIEYSKGDPVLRKQIESDYGSIDEHEKKVNAAKAIRARKNIVRLMRFIE